MEFMKLAIFHLIFMKEMTVSVRFYFSYEPLKWDYFTLIFFFSKRKNVDMFIVSDVTTKLPLHVWSYDFKRSDNRIMFSI